MPVYGMLKELFFAFSCIISRNIIFKQFFNKTTGYGIKDYKKYTYAKYSDAAYYLYGFSSEQRCR